MAPETTLRESHDACLLLQQDLESMDEVERAFVHADYAKRAAPEHAGDASRATEARIRHRARGRREASRFFFVRFVGGWFSRHSRRRGRSPPRSPGPVASLPSSIGDVAGARPIGAPAPGKTRLSVSGRTQASGEQRRADVRGRRRARVRHDRRAVASGAMKRRTTRRERVKIFRVASEKNVNAFGTMQSRIPSRTTPRTRPRSRRARGTAARGSRRWRRAEKPPRRPASASGAPPPASPARAGGGEARRRSTEAEPPRTFPTRRRSLFVPNFLASPPPPRRAEAEQKVSRHIAASSRSPFRSRSRFFDDHCPPNASASRGTSSFVFQSRSTRRPSRSRVRFRFRPPPYPPPYPTRHDSREHTSRERSRESLRRDSHRDSRFLQTGFSCPPICAAPRRARDARLRGARGRRRIRAVRRGARRIPALLLCIVQRADGALGGEGMNARTAVSAVRTDQEAASAPGGAA